MSARETAADAAYEAKADRDINAPSGRHIDNSYAMDASERRGAGPGGPIGKDTVNPVIRDDEPVDDPIDPNVADSDEMLGMFSIIYI